ncbi:unnamed protein product [Meloidogyne enterolobii]|uniref:Uncharacterized protein n=1 Tax=Meloidogyne enterolobii TaxID=390850 RepID=A0ACB0XTX0_MELEN
MVVALLLLVVLLLQYWFFYWCCLWWTWWWISLPFMEIILFGQHGTGATGGETTNEVSGHQKKLVSKVF